MPNRGEIAVPSRRPYSRAVAAPSDAWPIIAFCGFGALLSISMAIGTLGFGPVPSLLIPPLWG